MSRLSCMGVGLAILLAGRPASAQLSIGLECGPIIGTLAEKDGGAPGNSYAAGFALPYGITGGWAIDRHSTISTGILYQPFNVAFNGLHPLLEQTSPDPRYTDCLSKLQFHYLSVPVRFSYSIPASAELSVFAMVGVDIQLLIYARQNDYGYGTVYSQDRTTALSQQYFDLRKKVTPDYRAFNIPLEVAAGIRWQVGAEAATLRLGRSSGLLPVEKHRENGSHVSRGFFLTVGYEITIPPPSGKVCARRADGPTVL